MFDLKESLKAAHRQHAEGCVKTWEDLSRYRAIIDKVHPKLILEAGTFSGKSALWFALTAGCRVITVDVDPSNVDEDTRVAAGTAGVEFLTGRSTGMDVLARMRLEAGYCHGPVMVVLDGDHSENTVHDELLEYGTLVTPGSYCVVEDTIVRWMPNQMTPYGPYHGNPYDAVEGFVDSHPKLWVVDTEIEAMFPVTQSPGGFLRRIA